MLPYIAYMDPMGYGTSIWSIIQSIPSWIPITRTSPFKQPDLHRHPSDCRTRPEGDVMRPPRGALLLAICVAIGAGQWASTLGAMAAGQWGNGARGNEETHSKGFNVFAWSSWFAWFFFCVRMVLDIAGSAKQPSYAENHPMKLIKTPFQRSWIH